MFHVNINSIGHAAILKKLLSKVNILQISVNGSRF